MVSKDLLIEEIQACKLTRDRVYVDPRAVLVTPDDIAAEQAISESIGSTASGTGSALVRRMQRGADVRLVANSKRLRQFAQVQTVADLLHDQIDKGSHVIVEGTQGFGLSLLHGPGYPYVTSRDTTASGFASEVGLSPRDVDEIVMVIRTYPIRVGGNSGQLNGEIDWETIRQRSGAPELEIEYTSVTHRVRRVGEFDISAVRKAAEYNRPTALVLMGVDRLNYLCRGCKSVSELPHQIGTLIDSIQRETSVLVKILGTGPDTENFLVAPVFDRTRMRGFDSMKNLV